MASTSVRSFTAQRDDIVASRRSPAYQAYQVLHIAFVIAPVIAGLDKFADLLTNWDKYLAPGIADILPFSAHAFMMLVGIVEIAAGLVVAVKPRIGAYVVAAWLVAIIINLLMVGGYLDVALRDVGLCLGAIALARLSLDFDPLKGERVSHG
ncbi:MAG TPA: hypothetical protein VF765_25935 [Polyangiaceae bacterium]